MLKLFIAILNGCFYSPLARVDYMLMYKCLSFAVKISNLSNCKLKDQGKNFRNNFQNKQN